MTTQQQKAPVRQHRGFKQATIAVSAKGFNDMKQNNRFNYTKTDIITLGLYVPNLINFMGFLL
jgi:hypothetical protein